MVGYFFIVCIVVVYYVFNSVLCWVENLVFFVYVVIINVLINFFYVV